MVILIIPFHPVLSNQKGMVNMKNLANQRFGRLVAIEHKGRTRSCGCLNQEKHLTNPNRTVHGFTGKRIYRIWKKMKSRCHNPNDPVYKKWYGSQGIQVCTHWRNSFQEFYRWAICHGYKDDLSIDRIDPYKNYEPSNCRWATPIQQANNRRTTSKKEGGSH